MICLFKDSGYNGVISFFYKRVKMSKSDAKNPATPDESSQSGDALEIVSISLDELQAKNSDQEGLSQDKLNQVAEQINADLQENKAPNWQVETNWNETKVRVNLD